MNMSFRNERESKPDMPYMRTATLLRTEAIKLAQRVFDLQKKAPSLRTQELQRLYEMIESFEIQPQKEKDVDLTIRQGKVAIADQLGKHANAALQQAVYVTFLHDNYVLLQCTPGATATCELRVEDMITALTVANRHLAMFEALKNLEGKHYGVKAAKGGNTKNQRPSNNATTQLVHAMVKGMLYRNPNFQKLDKTTAADKIATRIFKVNSEYEILDIANPDDLKHLVRNVLFEISKKRGVQERSRLNGDRLQLGHSLRHSFPKQDTEESRQMDLDAARTLGRIEGVRATLILQLKQRFGDLPTSAIEKLEASNDMDQLQTYAEQLVVVRSLDDVIQNLQ
ncbi:hypothetical protein [Pseudomonas putida]|nr:hypothetical protein [Pseudomonas putida]